MGPDPFEPRASTSAFHHLTDDRRHDRSCRGTHGEEDPSRPGSGADREIGDDRFTDIVAERETVFSATLAPDDELAGAPVHVLELQASDLDRAQTEPSEQLSLIHISEPTRQAEISY